MDNPHILDEYQGFFAEFYDLLHAGNEDAALLPGLLRPYGSRVLELGCGTGRLAIPLAQAGFHVTGIENAPGMLEILARKAYPRENLQIHRADARSFQLDEAFDAILLGCNFINHFPDAAEVLSILRRCKSHLAPQGVVLLDGSVPDVCYLGGQTGIDSVQSFPTAHGTVIRDHFQAHFDCLNQIETDDITIEEYDGDTRLRTATAHETLTWYYPREIRSLVREAGLCVQIETGTLCDISGHTPIGPATGGMAFFCRHCDA